MPPIRMCGEALCRPPLEVLPEHLESARLQLDYATKHRDIIRKFGRFPHRNAMLGRESTADEIEFLKGGRGF